MKSGKPKALVLMCSMLLLQGTLFAQKISESSFEMGRNYVFIKVQVEDSKPLDFVFDTGAAAIVINRNVQRRLGLPVSRNVQAVGANGSTTVGEVSDQTLRVGDAILRHMNIYSAELTHLEEKLGRSIDGIIGHQLLQKYVVKLDYDQALISFYSNSRHPDLNQGTEVPISLSTQAPVVSAEIVVHGEKIKGKFILDTGMSGSVSINTPFVKRYRLTKKGPNVSHTSLGLGNSSTSYLTRMSELKLAGFTFKNLPSELNDGASGVSSGERQVGLIGNAIMRRFNIVFDYRNALIRIKPNAYFENPFPVNHIGFIFKATNRNKLVVADVLTPNKVDKAIKTGVELIAINGKEIGRDDLAEVHELISSPGLPVDMTFRIDGQAKKISIPRKPIL